MGMSTRLFPRPKPGDVEENLAGTSDDMYKYTLCEQMSYESALRRWRNRIYRIQSGFRYQIRPRKITHGPLFECTKLWSPQNLTDDGHVLNGSVERPSTSCPLCGTAFRIWALQSGSNDKSKRFRRPHDQSVRRAVKLSRQRKPPGHCHSTHGEVS
jgi:hypothetical protein